MNYERCMKYKCKICPKKFDCDKRIKEQHLTYRPFEDLPKILREKGFLYDNRTRQHNLYE